LNGGFGKNVWIFMTEGMMEFWRSVKMMNAQMNGRKERGGIKCKSIDTKQTERE
jgi:hypothetical protein